MTRNRLRVAVGACAMLFAVGLAGLRKWRLSRHRAGR
jgi:hypothetical protein